MIIKEIKNYKSFLIFLEHLKIHKIDVSDFIRKSELDQIGYYIHFIDGQGITFMCTNYSIMFGYNKNSNNNIMEDEVWKPISKHTIKFPYKSFIEVIKLAIVKSFEIITPF